MDKKTIVILILSALIACSVFFLGRSCSNGSTVDTDTDLYQNTLVELGNLRHEIAEYSNLIEKLGPELTSLTDRIEASKDGIAESQRGIESSLSLLGDITADSGAIGDITRELNLDIANIREASRGLSEIFGVETETD